MITPHQKQPGLAAAIGLPELYFKREDLHPYGSHKGRSIPTMIDHYRLMGDRHFAISSSGNAALAAALHIKKLNAAPQTDQTLTPGSELGSLSLDIFVGTHIAPHKLEMIRDAASKDPAISILSKERPLQALTLAVDQGARSLRQSIDDQALVGYESLAAEIAEIAGSGAVFIGTSSGTTAQALAQYFIEHKLPIQVHIIQTSSCHPLADAFDTFDIPMETSLADAIVTKTTYRKDALIPLISQTGGRGWLATNESIRTAQELSVQYHNLDISP